MKAGWLTLALLLASTCVSAQATLQSELDRVLLEERLTGIAWTLVHADGQAEIGTAGYEDSPAAVPFAPTTRFHVGSLTKTLLATGVLHLATEGRISLDAPAIRYLPELFTGERPAGFSKVTVRHLLDHFSDRFPTH